MRRRSVPGQRRLVLTAVFGVLALALAVSACGGSNPPSNAESAHVEDAFEFSKCMRENGVKSFPDPKVTAHGTELNFKGEGISPKVMNAAQSACRHFQEEGEQGPEPSPQEQAEREEQVQKFAKCMREHGIEVKASASHGGVQVGIRGGPGANPNSPALQKAQEACHDLLPGPSGHSTAHAASGGG